MTITKWRECNGTMWVRIERGLGIKIKEENTLPCNAYRNNLNCKRIYNFEANWCDFFFSVLSSDLNRASASSILSVTTVTAVAVPAKKQTLDPRPLHTYHECAYINRSWHRCHMCADLLSAILAVLVLFIHERRLRLGAFHSKNGPRRCVFRATNE